MEGRSAMSEIERQRDAALIGYNECRATIEDARRVLGATAHEGLLLAAMRVTEQLDRLAEVAHAVWDRWETPLWKDHPPTALVMNKLRDALAAVKGGKP
jgi:hypothetical protein